MSDDLGAVHVAIREKLAELQRENEALSKQVNDLNDGCVAYEKRLETAEGLLRRWLLTPWHEEYVLVRDTRSALGQGQGKEPIITGSSLEPTDRAQPLAPTDPVPGDGQK